MRAPSSSARSRSRWARSRRSTARCWRTDAELGTAFSHFQGTLFQPAHGGYGRHGKRHESPFEHQWIDDPRLVDFEVGAELASQVVPLGRHELLFEPTTEDAVEVARELRIEVGPTYALELGGRSESELREQVLFATHVVRGQSFWSSYLRDHQRAPVRWDGGRSWVRFGPLEPLGVIPDAGPWTLEVGDARGVWVGATEVPHRHGAGKRP